MRIYASIFLTIMLFFGVSTDVAPAIVDQTPSVEEKIDSLRYNNLVLLKYIEFKTKYWNYEEFYKQTDTVFSKQ